LYNNPPLYYTMSSAPVFKIIPGVQSYAWGKKGSSSLAAQLGERSIPDFSIDDEKPYAEVSSFSPTLQSAPRGLRLNRRDVLTE
jgi:hypothetical protein